MQICSETKSCLLVHPKYLSTILAHSGTPNSSITRPLHIHSFTTFKYTRNLHGPLNMLKAIHWGRKWSVERASVTSQLDVGHPSIGTKRIAGAIRLLSKQFTEKPKCCWKLPGRSKRLDALCVREGVVKQKYKHLTTYNSPKSLSKVRVRHLYVSLDFQVYLTINEPQYPTLS